MKYIFLLFTLSLPLGCTTKPLDDIVYAGSGELCTVSAVAGAKERCLRSDYQYDSPAWHPGGTVLLVEADVHDGPSNLLLLDENAEVVRKVPQSADFMRPAWSPDGKYFVAVKYGLGHAIGRWNADGTAFRTVPIRTEEPFQYVQMIAFSPDGTHAVLLVDDFKKMLVAHVDESDIEVEQVVPKGFSYVSQAAWLDDSRLIFVGKQGSPRAQLWELQLADATVDVRGIDGLWIRDFLALSPDRATVVVCGTPVGSGEANWSLWKYSLTPPVLTQLTNGIEDVTPSWRADKKRGR